MIRPPRWTCCRERGSSAVEYALLAALIGLVILGSVTLLGGKTAGLFLQACSSFPGSTSC